MDILHCPNYTAVIVTRHEVSNLALNFFFDMLAHVEDVPSLCSVDLDLNRHVSSHSPLLGEREAEPSSVNQASAYSLFFRLEHQSTKRPRHAAFLNKTPDCSLSHRTNGKERRISSGEALCEATLPRSCMLLCRNLAYNTPYSYFETAQTCALHCRFQKPSSI